MVDRPTPTGLTPGRTETLQALQALLAPLAAVDLRLAATYPGTVPRQPVHTCYVPADRMRADEASQWGQEALVLLDLLAPDQQRLEQVLDRAIAPGTHAHVRRILQARPVADLRVDVEDGYGYRSDDEEDAAVDAAVRALAAGPPPAYGIRVKPFEGPSAMRALRSLDRWITRCLESGIKPGVVTLPKVQDPVQVSVAVDVLEALEQELGSPAMTVEVQIETAAAVVDGTGRVPVPSFLDAGRGRVTGLHFGTYDYTAALGLAPQEQALDAPVADAAKDLLQLAAAARGVAVSDGSSNLLPVGEQAGRALREHGRLVHRALQRGLWQGWDLHPGQLVSRWATVVSFLLTRLPEVEQRLAGERADVADEPATVRMLRAFAARAQALDLRP